MRMDGKCMEKLRLFIWWPSRPTNPTPNQSYTNFHYHRPFHGCQKITFMSRKKRGKVQNCTHTALPFTTAYPMTNPWSIRQFWCWQFVLLWRFAPPPQNHPTNQQEGKHPLSDFSLNYKQRWLSQGCLRNIWLINLPNRGTLGDKSWSPEEDKHWTKEVLQWKWIFRYQGLRGLQNLIWIWSHRHSPF